MTFINVGFVSKSLESQVAVALSRCKTAKSARKALRTTLVKYEPEHPRLKEQWKPVVKEAIEVLECIYRQWSIHFDNRELLELVQYLTAPLLSRSEKGEHYNQHVAYGVLLSVFTVDTKFASVNPLKGDVSREEASLTILHLIGDLTVAQMNYKSYPYDGSAHRVWYASYESGNVGRNGELCRRIVDQWFKQRHLHEIDYCKVEYLHRCMITARKSGQEPLSKKRLGESGFTDHVVNRIARCLEKRNPATWQDFADLSKE